MSKFVEIAVKNSKEETAKISAEKVQPIIKAKIEAKTQAQKAIIIEKEIEVTEAESAVEKAQGFVTTDVDDYLEQLFEAFTDRDELAEDLKQAQSLLTELEATLEVFA